MGSGLPRIQCETSICPEVRLKKCENGVARLKTILFFEKQKDVYEKAQPQRSGMVVETELSTTDC
jgi:hypothetical protein